MNKRITHNSNLVIDIGNTTSKTAVFNENQLIAVEKDVAEASLHFLIKKYAINKAIVAKVGSSAIPDIGLKNVLQLNQTTPLPINIAYHSPNTLGADRIAAVCAACEKFPNTPALVIDIGSCITYDFANEENTFLGGAISPGPVLRYKAMHNFTAALPLLSELEAVDDIEKNTAGCMKSGVFNGILYEIEGFIHTFIRANPKGKVLLTGGFAKTFESKIKHPIFANPNLVLEGLNCILRFNDEK